MPTPIPNDPSDRTLLGRQPRPTADSSRQIFRTWDQRIKDQATLSARTTSAAYLDAIRKVLASISARQISPQDGERQLKSTLEHLGYRPDAGFPDSRGVVPPAKPGSITDLSSSRRIQLIIDTNVKQARSLGQVAASEDPKILMTAPAWKLTRTGARKKPRGDWKRRWTEAGKACGWYGASKNQMIALKTSPIWQKLADGAGGFEDTLGSPYPPFAFGSGMAWVNVDWDDWEELCRREGVPDHLEDITAKARELKAAQSGRNRPSVAATVPPTARKDGNRGPVGADVSPILGEIKRTSPVTVRTEPVKSLFRPDMTARIRADRAVDSAIAAIRKDEATVSGFSSGISDLQDECEALIAKNPDAKDKVKPLMDNFGKYQSAVARALAELKSLEGRVVNYGSAVGAIAVPAEFAQQGPFNAAMERWVQASARTVQSAHAAVKAAKMRSDAAPLNADAVRKAVWKVAKDKCLDIISQKVYTRYNDLYRDIEKYEQFYKDTAAKVPDRDKTSQMRLEADKFDGILTDARELLAEIEGLWSSIGKAANAGDVATVESEAGEIVRKMDVYDAAIIVMRNLSDSLTKAVAAASRVSREQDRKFSSIAKIVNHPEVTDDPDVAKAVEKMRKAQEDKDDEAFEAAHTEAVKAADKVWKPVTPVEISTNAQLQKIGAVHTLAEQDITKQTNPNYGKNSYKGEWDYNCQRCVPCAELIRRGYKVTARPLPKNSNPATDPLTYGLGWTKAFVGGNPVNFKSPEDAERIMRSWGDGARAEIRVAWKRRNGNGHVFFAEQEGDRTVFICPQTGQRGYDPWRWVAFRGKHAPKNMIMRIDNLDINPEFVASICDPD